MQADNSSNQAIISGGQGLGFAVARVMAQQGCTAIIITGRDAKRARLRQLRFPHWVRFVTLSHAMLARRAIATA